MKYIRDTFDFSVSEPSAVALGKFDGIHRGHRCLLREIKKGEELGYKSVVFTFDRSPKSLSDPNAKVLLTNREKEQIFAEIGIDYVIECPFTEELRRMEPDAVLKFFTDRINAKVIVTGTDFCFGYERKGTYRDLQKHEAEFGYRTKVMDKVQSEGLDISSSRIRALIGDANLQEANLLLGYPYFMTSAVDHGNRFGHEMGIPTINQTPPAEKLLPPNGVYASAVSVDGRTWYGATNIGQKPTTGEGQPLGVETHIFDFDSQIYGQEVKVAFLAYLREEKQFASVAELRGQIARDCDMARGICEKCSLQ